MLELTLTECRSRYVLRNVVPDELMVFRSMLAPGCRNDSTFFLGHEQSRTLGTDLAVRFAC